MDEAKVIVNRQTKRKGNEFEIKLKQRDNEEATGRRMAAKVIASSGFGGFRTERERERESKVEGESRLKTNAPTFRGELNVRGDGKQNVK
jgi:hypothetical protein